MKKIIRLTEQDLHKVIQESVNKILGEAIKPKHWKNIDENVNEPNMQRLVKILQMAAQNNMAVYDTVVYGFRFMVNWNDKRKWFEGAMLFAPDNSSVQHLYGYTIEDFVKEAKRCINDAMKYYKNGGRYPDDYPTNVPM